jgi:hypothetical protein
MPNLKITIEVAEVKRGANTRYKPTVAVGATEWALGECYTQADALDDAIEYVRLERRRGDHSRFALFHISDTEVTRAQIISSLDRDLR